jgi:aryl-alcohol dehydrogenase-like predicted oxidoreductase
MLGSTVLKYRQLGASALQVPVISLGSWLTYSGGIEKRQAMACIHKALDLGINLFDTANVYPPRVCLARRLLEFPATPTPWRRRFLAR